MADQEEMQWELITPDTHPDRPDVLAYIAERPVGAPARYKHTGRNFFRKLQACPSLAEMVIAGFRMGMSVRLLALRCGVSPKTLAECRRMLEQRGELAPVRRRVDRLLDQVVEEGLEYWLEAMRSGHIHPGQIPIPALAALDKMSQRDAGLVVGTERTLEETALARLTAAAQALGLVAGASGAPDLQSAQTAANPEQIDVSVVVDTAPDTAGTPPAAGGDPADGPAAPTPAGAQADTQGGGSPAAGPPGDRWATPDEIPPQSDSILT